MESLKTKDQNNIYDILDDGQVALLVDHIEGTDIVCVCANNGVVKSRRGVNVPEASIKMDYLSSKDIADIEFGCRQDVDFIAASFVRSKKDVIDLRKFMDYNGGHSIKIIAKIENQEGLDNLDAIIEASDGIMVARGDLGVEVAPEKLPHLQKMMIEKCSQACKIVITATQMLDSMIRNPRPTRAEVTDVANAVYDGTDVVMLSGETANGKYPVEALKMMVQIVTEAESHLGDTFYKVRRVGETSSHDISNAVCYASVTTARALEAKVILSPTISGYTARMLSKWHPAPRIVCVSANQESVRRMQLYWGVTPLLGAWAENIDDKIMHAIDMLKAKDIVEEGDLVVVTAGTQGHSRKNEPATATNGMRVVVVD